ncbi:MAG: serine hydrolase, partial [Pseudomonadota bacterium]
MNGESSVILGTLVIYKLLLVGIGVWASRRSGSEGDFLIGGRGLGAWVAGLSYAATSSSAWVLLGFSGFVYAVMQNGAITARGAFGQADREANTPMAADTRFRIASMTKPITTAA